MAVPGVPLVRAPARGPRGAREGALHRREASGAGGGPGFCGVGGEGAVEGEVTSEVRSGEVLRCCNGVRGRIARIAF